MIGLLAAAALAADPALDALAVGDRAWYADDRRAAVRAWREALSLADASPAGRAAEAMARLRLVHHEGNLAPVWHEPRITRALAACPAAEPWCAVAAADWEWLMPAFVGADPAHIPARLGALDTGPAVARRVLAGTAPLAALPGLADRDGLGDGMVATGRARPPVADTWLASLGLAAAPGAGVGAQLRFVHPDLGWRRHHLDLRVAVDSLGGASLRGTVALAAPARPWTALTLAHQRGWRWLDDGPRGYTLDLAAVALGVEAPRDGVGWRPGLGLTAGTADGESALTVGPRLGLGGAHAGTAGAAETTAEWGVLARIEAGDAPFAAVSAGVGGGVRAGRLGVRGRVGAEAAPVEGTPFWRLPSAGGATLVRGAPAGRWRGPTLVSAQLEGQADLVGPLRAALWVDGARVDGLHGAVGGGLRLVLPPERLNTTRVDVGVSDAGWGVIVALGEAF